MSVEGRIDEIDVDEFAALLSDDSTAGDVVLIDVRQPDEYLEVRVPGVTLIPLPEIPDRHGEIPAADTVYVICKLGGRSMKACEFLAAQGRDVVNIAGGTTAWVDSGRAVESGPELG